MNLNFGSNVVYGSFGTGKTYVTFYQAYKEKLLHGDEVFVIANVPYPFVDLFFSTKDELLEVIKLLESYVLSTNRDIFNYGQNRDKYKRIIFIIDEAHLYFDPRHSLLKGNNMEHLQTLLTQCRKRNIKFYMITQRLSNIDIRIRKLSDYVFEYRHYSIVGIHWTRYKEYENIGDILDLEADTVMRISDGETVTYKQEALLDSGFVRPISFYIERKKNDFHFFAKITHSSKAYKDMLQRKHLSLYVVSFEDKQVNIDEMKHNKLFYNLVKEKYRQFIDINTKNEETPVLSLNIIEQPKTPKKFLSFFP